MRPAPPPRVLSRVAAVQQFTKPPSSAFPRRLAMGAPSSAQYLKWMQGYQDWQTDAKRYARTTGVARFTGNVVANAAGRCLLRVEEQNDRGDWNESEDDEIVALIDEYQNETLGQTAPELVRLHAWHYQIAGEGALIVRDNSAGEAEWLVVSLGAIDWNHPTHDECTVRLHPQGLARDGTAFVVPRRNVIRFWMPDEEYLALAVSPMTAAMDDLKRYTSLTRYAQRSAESYLALNGILWTPQTGAHDTDEIPDSGPEEGQERPDRTVEAYRQWAQVGIAEDDRLESVVPPMMWWDGPPPQWVKIGEGLDEYGIAHRREALQDWARAVDIPGSLVAEGGPGGQNHWVEWLVDEKFFNAGVAPTLNRITHQDLTVAYLHPRLRLMGKNETDLERYRIGYDPTPVIVHPDKSDKALRAWLAGLLKADVVLQEMGFDPDDLAGPEDLERLQGVLTGFANGIPGRPPPLPPAAPPPPPGTSEVGKEPVGPATTEEKPPEGPPQEPATANAASLFMEYLGEYLPGFRAAGGRVAGPQPGWGPLARSAASPADQGVVVALPGPDEQSHMTLLFVAPDAQDADPAWRGSLSGILAAVAADTAAPEVRLDRLDRFPSSNVDGTEPVVLLDSEPDTVALHHRIARAAQAAGVSFSERHQFVPHVTVAYAPSGQGPPPSHLNGESIEYRPDVIELRWGREVVSFPFGDRAQRGMSHRVRRAYSPEQERDERGRWTDEGDGDGGSGGNLDAVIREYSFDMNSETSREMQHDAARILAGGKGEKHDADVRLLLNAIHDAKPETWGTGSFYRGGHLTAEERESLHIGSKVEWPLASASRTPGVALAFSDWSLAKDQTGYHATREGEKVVYRIDGPLQFVNSFHSPHLEAEIITSGEFRVSAEPYRTVESNPGLLPDPHVYRNDPEGVVYVIPVRQVSTRAVAQASARVAYSPEQERDERGRWTDEGGGEGPLYPGRDPNAPPAEKQRWLPPAGTTLYHGSRRFLHEGDEIKPGREQPSWSPEQWWTREDRVSVTTDPELARAFGHVHEVRVVGAIESDPDGEWWDREGYPVAFLAPRAVVVKEPEIPPEPVWGANARVAYSEDQPRDEYGRWTDEGGGGGAGEDRGKGTVDPVEHARSLTTPKERADYYYSLDKATTDRMADAPNTVQAKIDTVSDKLGAHEPGESYATRAGDAATAELITPESAEVIGQAADSLRDTLAAAGVAPDLGERLSTMVCDSLIAQENEALAHTVGDHGESHLLGDAQMTVDLLRADPNYEFTPRDEALAYIGAAFHDTGYLTPPGELASFDKGHADWGADYYDARVSDLVAEAFDAETASMLSDAIRTHSGTEMDWEGDPFGSAFRLSDNLALFQNEKLPGVADVVPANVGVLVDLGAGRIGFPEAQEQMRSNIASADLSEGVKTRLYEAVDSTMPSLPQFMLGMLGAKVEQVAWRADHPVVTVNRTDANEALSRVIDGGQAQFDKLAKTYGVDPQSFRSENEFAFRDPESGGTLLEVRVEGVPLTAAVRMAALRRAILAYSPEQARDERGRWTSDGGSETVDAVSSGGVQHGMSPLPYRHSYPVKRMSVIDPRAPVDTRDDYFKPGGYEERLRGERKSEHVDGPPERTVAFLDYHEPGDDRIAIDYVAARSDYEGLGIGMRLITRLYDENPEKVIDWGDVYDESAWRLYQQMRETRPDQTGRAKNYATSLAPQPRMSGVRLAYSVDQARDERGRWTDEAGGADIGVDSYSGALRVASASMASFDEKMQARIIAQVDKRVGDHEQILPRFRAQMEAAKARGVDDPDGTWQEGIVWYGKYHDDAVGISEAYGVTLEQSAGAIAAASQGIDPVQLPPVIEAMADMDRNDSVTLDPDVLDRVNAKLACMELSPVENGTPYADLDSRTAVVVMQSEYQQGISDVRGWGVSDQGYAPFAKALNILRGADVDEVLEGVKIRNFYNCIADPTDPEPVAIDRWMFRIAADDPDFNNDSRVTGVPSKSQTVTNEDGSKTILRTDIGPTPYIADQVRIVADEYGVTPQQAQAIIWVEYQRSLRERGERV